MTKRDLSQYSPYELGEYDHTDALPYLIRYLYRGNSNERRLAASAVGKLARNYREACSIAAVALLDCLDDPGPQTRLYALKTLAMLPLPPEAENILVRISTEDEKPYNRDEAMALLNRFGETSGTQEVCPPLEPEPQSDATHAPDQRAEAARPSSPSTLDILNRLLEAVYGEPRRLSDLLRNAGLSAESIAELRREHLHNYVLLVTQQLQAWIQRVFPERTADICIQRFELDGHPAPTLADLGKKYDVTRERIRQLEVKVLKRLRSRRSQVAIEQIIARAAQETLKLPITVSVADHTGAESRPAPAASLPRRAGESALYTLARFEAGLSPGEIAAERNLTESTIYTHLAACIRTGSKSAVQAVTPEMVQVVRDILDGDDPPVSFTELRYRMPESFSYGLLACVLAAHPEFLPETRALSPEEIQQAKRAIRALVADISGELPRSGIIKILVGSSSKRIAEYEDHPGYAALVGFNHAALWQIIDDLVTSGDLALDDHSRLVYLDAPPRQPITEVDPGSEKP